MTESSASPDVERLPSTPEAEDPASALELERICPLTISDALLRAAAIAPDVDAVVAPQERITFQELAERVSRIRAALVAHGVGRGHHVAICVGNCPDWVALFLAIGSVGAVAVPINTRFKPDELAYALRQSRCRTLFLADRLLNVDFIAMLRSLCPGIDTGMPDAGLPALERVVVLGTDVPAAAESWRDFLLAAGEPQAATCTPGDTLLIQYTSGTTAYPKGVLLTHRSICANAFFSGQRIGLRSGDRFYSARPFFHVAGTTLSIIASIQHTVTLVTAERFQAAAALELMERERCTHFSGNDTIALMLLSDPSRERRRLCLRGAWLAASPAIVTRVMSELGATEAVVGYGLSEASPNVAQSCWWEPQEMRAQALMAPEPGVQVRICNPVSGDHLGADKVGEIRVHGWNVMQGYFDMPVETAAVLGTDRWLRTGDLGSLDASGRLKFVGRLKETIRVGGENVSPAEIEDALHRHPAVRQAAVVGVPDERLLEVPFAFVVPGEDCVLDPDALADWLKQRLAGYKVPHHFELVDSFEQFGMTASSKVRKADLAAAAQRLMPGD